MPLARRRCWLRCISGAMLGVSSCTTDVTPEAAKGPVRVVARGTMPARTGNQLTRDIGWSWQQRAIPRAGSMEMAEHMIVTAVTSESPAAAAGIKVGDRVLTINGFDTMINPEQSKFIPRSPRNEIRLLRDGKQLTLNVDLRGVEH